MGPARARMLVLSNCINGQSCMGMEELQCHISGVDCFCRAGFEATAVLLFGFNT